MAIFITLLFCIIISFISVQYVKEQERKLEISRQKVLESFEKLNATLDRIQKSKIYTVKNIKKF